MMNISTIRNIWALFGVIWFVIFFLLTFVRESMEPVAIAAAISLYAGIILAAFTIIYLAYKGLRGVMRRAAKDLAS
jgi:Na+/melibiose symporter-like transporter